MQLLTDYYVHIIHIFYRYMNIAHKIYFIIGLYILPLLKQTELFSVVILSIPHDKFIFI